MSCVLGQLSPDLCFPKRFGSHFFDVCEWIDVISSLSLEETVDVEVPRSLLKRLFGLEVMLDDLRLAFFSVSTLFSIRVLMTASRRAASRLAFLGRSMHRSSVDTALSVIMEGSR